MNIRGALFGGIVGDALGVPVEFKSRSYLKSNPVIDMFGYGTYGQPPGTWSDDTAMALAVIHVINEHGGCYPKLIMEEWREWYQHTKWTPYGDVFDIGISTSNAINRFINGQHWSECGGRAMEDNGNGSLMRTMPISLYGDISLPVSVSRMTHAHPISLACCLYHYHLVTSLCESSSLLDAMRHASSGDFAILDNDSQKELNRILNGSIIYESEDKIRGSGYVVHCLEASLWCLHNSDNYKDAVLKAVNLGEDTDTTGCVTGGLAGLIYGFENIPEAWVESLAKKDDIEKMIDKFIRLRYKK